MLAAPAVKWVLTLLSLRSVYSFGCFVHPGLRIYALKQELQEVEAKWAPKLEDAMDEIELLKSKLEEWDGDGVAVNEKYATLSKECKRSGQEIAALCEAVANIKTGKRDKEVQKFVQTEVKWHWYLVHKLRDVPMPEFLRRPRK